MHSLSDVEQIFRRVRARIPTRRDSAALLVCALLAVLSAGLDPHRHRPRGRESSHCRSGLQSVDQDAKNADLLKTFNDTLWNDLDNAGIFDMVSKSFFRWDSWAPQRM